MGQWRIRVYENSHHGDEDEAYDLADTFDSEGEAVARAKAIVDADLSAMAASGKTAAAMFDAYRMFGEDPHVTGPGGSAFSAWDYAKGRCEELAG